MATITTINDTKSFVQPALNSQDAVPVATLNPIGTRPPSPTKPDLREQLKQTLMAMEKGKLEASAPISAAVTSTQLLPAAPVATPSATAIPAPTPSPLNSRVPGSAPKSAPKIVEARLKPISEVEMKLESLKKSIPAFPISLSTVPSIVHQPAKPKDSDVGKYLEIISCCNVVEKFAKQSSTVNTCPDNSYDQIVAMHAALRMLHLVAPANYWSSQYAPMPAVPFVPQFSTRTAFPPTTLPKVATATDKPAIQPHPNAPRPVVNHYRPNNHVSTTERTIEVKWTAQEEIIKKKRKAEPHALVCHSCGVTTTPEWRRGPNGPKTLCNACGLHYAKIIKRQKKDTPDEQPHPLKMILN
jgi:hypothetical protein